MQRVPALGIAILGDTLDWPFFEDRHRAFAAELSGWADSYLADLPHDDVDEACRARVAALGAAGFLKAAVPAAYGGLAEKLDVPPSASPARFWRRATGWRISPSPCRASAPARSRSPGRRR